MSSTDRITNEVLAERLEGLKTLLLSDLSFIKEQTVRTNGRVTMLEVKTTLTDSKVNKFVGGLVVVNVVMGIVASILLKFF